MLALKHFRDKAKGAADLLNWASLIDPGIVLNKDGSLLAGFVYRGDDMGSATAQERNYLTAQVNATLARFGSGFVAWFDCTRLPAPGYPPREASSFPDPVTSAIEEERRRDFTAAGACHESELALMVQYLPPLRRNTRVNDLIYDDDPSETPVNSGDRILAQFKKALRELQNGLSTVLNIQRMQSFKHVDEYGNEYQSDQLLNYLRLCFTGENIAVRVPPYGMYLDAFLGGVELWPGDTPRIGDTFVAVVAIEGYPAFSEPGMLDLLENLSLPFRWSSRFVFLDGHQATGELKKYQRQWKQKGRGFVAQVLRMNSTVNEDALLMAREAETAMGEAESGLVAFGYYTPCVVLMGPVRDELLEDANTILTELKRRGFTGRIETVNAMEAWLGTLPGHALPNLRRPVVHTLNLSDLLPLTTIWPGRQTNPCPFYPANSPPLLQAATTGSTPFRLNLHVGELGHTLIFGPTRAGKSTLLATIAAQFRRYPRAKVTVFDKGNSMWTLANAIGEPHGARHYDVGSDSDTTQFCPLAHIDAPADRAWAVDWIETLFLLQKARHRTTEEHDKISAAIKLMSEPVSGAVGRSLTHFYHTVQDKEVQSAVSAYLLGTPVGNLLDGEADGLNDATFRVFELEHLLKMGERNLLPVMLYVIRRFQQSLDGGPALLIIDEAWTFFKAEFMHAKIEEWCRVLAKANCVIIMATQSLHEANTSGILPILQESCPTKIYLPNQEAEERGPRALYEAFGLNDTEISILATARRQRQYYFTNWDGRRLIDLGLGPVALSFVGVSDKDTLRHLAALKERHGEDWPRHWLAEKGLTREHGT